jgi:hypothetical protein
MSSAPSLDDLQARVALLEEQVRALSTAPRAPFTSIPDADGNEAVRLSVAGLEFFNPDGTRRSRFDGRQLLFYAPTGEVTVILGEVTWSDIDSVNRVEQGLLVQRTDGKDMLAIGANGRGLLKPVMTYQPHRLNDFVVTTAGAFTAIWQYDVPSIPSNSISVTVAVGADAGTTGEVRLAIGGLVTNAQTVPAGTLNSYVFKWDIEEAGLDISSQFFCNVEVRRTGGAGNLNVYTPQPLRTWDDLLMGADVDGIYP